MKPATTYEQQYNLLINRGLICGSKREVISFLKENSYYRFTGYLKLYTKQSCDDFIDGLTFDRMMKIYTFDSEMRSLINKLVAQIEVSVRTQLAYNLSNQLDPLCYKKKEYFIDYEFFKKTKSIIKVDIGKASSDPMVKHFDSTKVPFWVIIEIISLGTVSKLYANLKSRYKKLVSSGTYYSINYKYFENYLNVCTSLRNTCAHRGRLYGKRFTTSPRYTTKEKNAYGDINIADDYFISNGSSATLFECLYICLKLINKKKDRTKYVSAFQKLINKFNDDIELIKIGFPTNWVKILSNK